MQFSITEEFSVLRRSASFFLVGSCSSEYCRLWLGLFWGGGGGGEESFKDAISAASASPSLGSQWRFPVSSLGLGLPPRSAMVFGSGSSPTGHFSDSSPPTPRLLVRRLGRGLGSSPPGKRRLRPVVSGGSHSVYKRKGASCSGKRISTVRTSAVQFHSGTFLRQLHSPSVSAQTRRYPIDNPHAFFQCVDKFNISLAPRERDITITNKH